MQTLRDDKLVQPQIQKTRKFPKVELQRQLRIQKGFSFFLQEASHTLQEGIYRSVFSIYQATGGR